MKTPDGEFVTLPAVASTQDIAREYVERGETPAVIFTHHQTKGRGRFQRTWHSEFGDSLTMSILFHDYPDHKEPWLVGMSTAIAVASTLHCQIQWPNDLVFHGKKVGGILTELIQNRQGQQIPVVGVGLNLNQSEFPEEIADRATSIKLETNRTTESEALAYQILNRLKDAPEPKSWAELAPAWQLFDATPGKSYKLLDGKIATAIGLGPNGQLICSVDGETTSVLAAEALFGQK